ncbi:CI repressor [Riemerella anatipestifer]|uniref:helix-turn-helix domain-containing protein n=1 Tax=Riemerella anatipestifer TaxID=34085 RepID=UPI000D68FA86|nr:helix-turn-helix domain-containing protein [Riemerella anatipestifer]MRM85199.1 CI repressor [Riemerella anatipestifer]MRM94404.1 CI repressor [Riemerella anatipestifer]WPC13088.1 helix-turn-helix domain containing protein [Riemerella anatipestifer]WPC15099.1 helix-turn-helix domain containing protein [Riemerella anatipestifer]
MDKKLILREIKKHLGYTKDGDFADFLGIKQNTLSNWKSRNTIDYDLIISKCENIDANWLLTGKGEMLKQPQGYATEQTPPPVVAEGQNSYGNNTEVELLRKQVALLEENRLLHQEIKQLQERINRLELDNTSIKSKLQNRATG